MKIFSRLIVLSLAVTFSSVSFADDEYFKVEEVTIRELSPVEMTLLDSPSEQELQSACVDPAILDDDMGDADDIDKIINIGQKIWKFIVDNKPVVNVKRDRATALPSSVRSSYELTEWKGPSISAFEVKAKNGFGSQVVKFVFKLSYMYGGKYNGYGKYLTNVTVIPSAIEASWGYTLNVDVSVADVLNVGTKVNPVGGIGLELKYSIDTVVKHSQSTVAFFVKGDGSMVQN